MKGCWLMTLVLLLSGCVEVGASCETSAECNVTADCVEGRCVPRACTPACGTWESCVEGGCTAQYTKLTIDSPGSGATVSESFEVRVALTQAQSQAAEPPSKVELVSTPASGPVEHHDLPLVAGTLTYRGTVSLKSGGRVTLTATSADLGLTAAAVEVTAPAAKCTPACDEKSYCVNGKCEAAFKAVEIQEPAPKASIPDKVTVKVAVIREAGAETAYPANVVVVASRTGKVLPGVSLPHTSGGIYVGEVTPDHGGDWTVVAKSEVLGLQSAPVSFRVTGCPQTCKALETCRDGGCVAAFTGMEFVAPTNQGTSPGVTQVEVKVLRVEGAANPYPGTVKVTPSFGGSDLSDLVLQQQGGNGTYKGEFTPYRGGEWTLVAKSAELGLEPTQVVFRVTGCGTFCKADEECDGNGECVKPFASLTITAPASGSSVGPAGVDVTAVLARRDRGSAAWPAKVVLTVKGATTESLDLVGADGTYTGMVVPKGAGTYVLEAQGGGLTSPSVSITTDFVAPTFAVVVATPFPTRATHEADPQGANHWRRDEEIDVEVTSDDTDVNAATVTASAEGVTGGTKSLSLTACTGSSKAFCRRAKVSLGDSALEMNAFRGNAKVKVNGKDSAGNESAKSLDVPVTRWKWAYDPQAGAIKTAPAIGKSGVVYIGTGNTPGKAIAVKPDGTKAWEFTTGGAIEASIVVGEVNATETVFVAGVSGGAGAVWGLTSANVTSTPAPAPLATYGTKVSATPALFTTQAGANPPLATVAAVFNKGTSSKLLAIRLDTPVEVVSTSYIQDADGDTGLAVNGNQVFFGDTLGRVQSYSFDASAAWVALPGWPVTVGAGNKPTNPIVTDTGIAGGGGGVGVGRFFSVPFSGAPLTTLDSEAPVWNVTAPAGLFVAGSTNGKLLTTVSSLGGAITSHDIEGVARGAPALGRDGMLHVATDGPQFRAMTTTGLTRWSVTLDGASYSSPALDCTRNAAGTAIAGRPGVVYVGADDGKLYAFITDSRGLDTTAPWPKFHRDPGNTGNADVALGAFACP